MIVMKSSVFPAGRETVFEIYIVRFDPEGVSSREGNEQVPVWNHDITMLSLTESRSKAG